MIVKGEGFKWFIDGESRTYDQAISEINDNMKCTMDGLNIYYTSPKKVKTILDVIDEHQEKIGGRIEGVEFPYDFSRAEEEVLSEYDKRSIASIMMGTPTKFKLEDSGIIKNYFLKPNEEMKQHTSSLLSKTNGKCSPSCFCSGSCKKVTPPDNLKNREIMTKPITPEEAFKKCYGRDATEIKVGKKESQVVKKAPIFTYCKVNKHAIEALSLRALLGHEKYEVGDDWENFSRLDNGDFEYANAEFRHALGIGEETEEQHLVAQAWNAVARLEIYYRNKK